jgi:hypothetical protein
MSTTMQPYPIPNTRIVHVDCFIVANMYERLIKVPLFGNKTYFFSKYGKEWVTLCSIPCNNIVLWLDRIIYHTTYQEYYTHFLQYMLRKCDKVKECDKKNT